MIEVEKIQTENPFTDNLIYYTKYIALNSVVKDLDEANNNETLESIKAGDILIACIEGHAVFEMFTYFPAEILEKYVPVNSNIDLMVNSNDVLRTYLNSLSSVAREKLLNNLSKLAQTIYIDHYDIMLNYITTIGPTWLDDNKELYNKCLNATATLDDLYDIIPLYTRKRIIKQYLNNYDIDKLDTLSTSLEEFNTYIASRVDNTVNSEVENIVKAMTSCFISHYDTIVQRQYVTEDNKNNWYEYIQFTDVYDMCQTKEATYIELYELFPEDDLLESLQEVFSQETIDTYALADSLDNLIDYFDNFNVDPELENSLNAILMDKYMRNYSLYVNFDVYNKCKAGIIDFYDLKQYMPWETNKIVLNTFIKEVTNIEIYSENLDMLYSYLGSIPVEQADEIRDNITKDMCVWYVNHYEELNNYYRTYLGLPPLDEYGNAYTDTLLQSYDAKTDSYIKFGDELINMIPETIYPKIHWTKNQIYEFDSYDVSILEEYGVIDKYLELCSSSYNSSRYKYLNFLGDKSLDAYTCRRAENFQLIGLPTIEAPEVRKMYTDKYAVNRDYVIRTVYTDSHKFQSDYYNKFIIIFIVMNTIMDVLTDIPRMIINRDVFDTRCIKYIFEAYGIPYYPEIPIKYQQAMLKNLNILIKYKSSSRNMVDICNLFGFEDIRVFKYYMLKERVVDSTTGEYIFSDNNDIDYDLDTLYILDRNGKLTDYNGIKYSKLTTHREFNADNYTKTIVVYNDDGTTESKKILKSLDGLYVRDPKYEDVFTPLTEMDYFKKIKADTNEATLKFVRVPTDEQLTEYKNDTDYIMQYDEITYGDDTWDGGLLHEELKQDILDYEFNAVLTKYISIETVTQMTELSFQVSYFYNMLFDNIYSEEALTVEIPYIAANHKFRFMDVVCYLFALMYLYNGIEDNIMYSPTQMLYIKGYNFDSDLDKVLEDVNAFTQPENAMDRENIFDINKRIKEDGYDYQKAFENYDIKAFNLNVDIDALDEWLKEEHQLTLDDFITSDGISLRQFYSLNNSYYQKNIFKYDLLVPSQHNQILIHAYDYTILEKKRLLDANGNTHEYVHHQYHNVDGIFEYYNLQVVNTVPEDNMMFMYYDTKYLVDKMGRVFALYYEYSKTSENTYSIVSHKFYTYENGAYVNPLPGSQYILNDDGLIIFASDAYYVRSDALGQYVQITDDKYFSDNPLYGEKCILNYGEYYILQDSKYVLDPENCYVKLKQGEEITYILLKDADEYQNTEVAAENCFILHSDGHFIRLTETDFYIKNEDGSYTYNEEECYKISETPTEYYDKTADPIVYYEKLSDYYARMNYIVYTNVCYVKNANGEYIPESDLINPDNCYYYENGNYVLVKDNLYHYADAKESIDSEHLLLLQSDNTYARYFKKDDSFILDDEPNMQYIKNSDPDYVTVIITDSSYANTSEMIVIMNRAVYYNNNEDELIGIYDPEKTDGVWDENDWFYPDASYDENSGIGMNGENKWYYRKPGVEIVPPEDTVENTFNNKVGSGFYLTANAYLGDIKIEEGIKYYISMDIETNFTGEIQICCEADPSSESAANRIYYVEAQVQQHIAQVFTANGNAEPDLLFLVYNFADYPIECGDYVIIRNIRVVRAYSDNYIAQDIESYDKLQELYRTNEAIYKYLVELMNNCSDFHTYQIYKKLFDSLMLSKYNKEAFKLTDGSYAKTYTEFLQTRDTVLYDKLMYFRSLEQEARNKEIADNIIEVSYAIDDCIDTYSYSYLYSYFPAVSASYIQQYISKVIDFFKSWKVHLLGINTVYKFGDESENMVKILYHPDFRVKESLTDYVNISGTIKINPMDSYSDDGTMYKDKYPDLTMLTTKYEDNVEVKDSVRLITRTADRLEYYDDVSKINLILNKDEITAKVDDNGDLVVSDNSGLSVELPNSLMLETNEDIEWFGMQNIGELNLDSTDVLGE